MFHFETRENYKGLKRLITLPGAIWGIIFRLLSHLGIVQLSSQKGVANRFQRRYFSRQQGLRVVPGFQTGRKGFGTAGRVNYRN